MANSATKAYGYNLGTALSSTPAELIVALYDGAQRFLRQAGAAMGEGQVERSHNLLRRAENVISYLDSILDMSQGEIPAQLHSIYRFCLRHLGAARINQDARKVDEVRELLAELRESWSQVSSELERQ